MIRFSKGTSMLNVTPKAYKFEQYHYYKSSIYFIYL